MVRPWRRFLNSLYFRAIAIQAFVSSGPTPSPRKIFSKVARFLIWSVVLSGALGTGGLTAGADFAVC